MVPKKDTQPYPACVSSRDFASHRNHCKRKVPGPNTAGQAGASSNARRSTDNAHSNPTASNDRQANPAYRCSCGRKCISSQGLASHRRHCKRKDPGQNAAHNNPAARETVVERLSHNDSHQRVSDRVDDSGVMQGQNQKLALGDPVVIEQQNQKRRLDALSLSSTEQGSHKDGRQGVAEFSEKSLVKELEWHELPFKKRHKFDPNVSNGSVVMQEQSPKIGRNATAPITNSDKKTPSVSVVRNQKIKNWPDDKF